MKAKQTVTRKKPPVEQPEEDEIGLITDTTYTADDLSPGLAALYSELGIEDETGATVHVSIMREGKEFQIWRGDPSAYDLWALSREFGTGDYRVKLYVPDPTTGRKPCRGMRTIAMMLSPADEKARIAAQQQAQNQAPAQDQTLTLFGKMLEAQAAQTAAIIQSIRESMPREKDPLQTLEGVKQIAEIIKPQSTPQRTMLDTLTEMKAIMALSETMKPPAPIANDDGSFNAGGVVSKALDIFGNAMAEARKREANSAQPHNAPAQTLPADSNALIEQQSQDDEYMMMLKMQLSAACALAKASADHAEFAEGVYELLPDDLITSMADDPEWLAKLSAVEPRCSQYPEWFARVKNRIVDMAREDGILPPLPATGENNVVSASTVEKASATGGDS